MKICVDKDLLVSILENAIDNANEIAQQYSLGAKQGYPKYVNRYEEYANSADKAAKLLDEVNSESHVYGFQPINENCKPEDGEKCIFRHKRLKEHKRWLDVYLGKFSGKLNDSMYVEWMPIPEER